MFITCAASEIEKDCFLIIEWIRICYGVGNSIDDLFEGFPYGRNQRPPSGELLGCRTIIVHLGMPIEVIPVGEFFRTGSYLVGHDG